MVQNPLQIGADICVHSVTKYLSGHSDILLGCTVVKDTSLLNRLEQSRRYGGAIAGPFEAWLALREYVLLLYECNAHRKTLWN